MRDGTQKTTEFKYLLERKALRIMRRYYKEQFEKMFKYKNKMKEITRQEFMQMVRQFARVEFNPFPHADQLTEGKWEDIYLNLAVVILCDRYNKPEPVVKEFDFTLIRNVLNKYNTKNLTSFMRPLGNAFLYAHFFLSKGLALSKS